MSDAYGVADGARKRGCEGTSIRAARTEERDAIIALCLRATASRGHSAHFLARCRESLTRTLTAARLDAWSLRVAVRDADVPLGVAASRGGGGDAELELLFVEPALARQGIGTALLADRRRLLAAAGARALKVLSEPAAEGFYLRHGAVRLGLRSLESFPALPPRPWLRLPLATATPTLETERLLLRPWHEADLGPFAALNADRQVMRRLGGPLGPAASDALAARLDSFARHGLGHWAVERKDRPGRPFIGAIGLLVPSFDAAFTPCVEIGWRLAADHHGAGLASEGARAALAHAFDAIGLDEVVAFTVPANTASRRVMDRIGMRRDAGADFEHPKFPPGHPLRRHLLYRIARDEGLSCRDGG